jgi:hypothetical protein
MVLDRARALFTTQMEANMRENGSKILNTDTAFSLLKTAQNMMVLLRKTG